MTTPVRDMFERIAPTYDLVNRAMTLGLDRSWRAATVRQVPREATTLLDLCAGTLDLCAEVARTRPDAALYAIDFSRRMLLRGREKIGNDVRLQVACADAAALPLRSASFDAALCGFGVRNLPDRPAVLAEIRRALRPGGVFVVLDLFVPEGAVARAIHDVHTHAVVPLLGRILSGDDQAYRYLPHSVDRFVTRREFEAELRAAGFESTQGREVGLGAVSIVRAVS